MTKVLTLSLLGPLELALDDTPVMGLASAKAEALLCYLAMNGRAHSRQALAGLLWGDLPEADARRNLRGVIMKLRQLFDPYLLVNFQTVAFNRQATYRLDVEQFRAGLQSRDLATLRYCAALYRGDFLEELFVRQSPEFETWQQQQRAQLHQQAIAVFTLLVNRLREQGEWEEGLAAARRLVSLDSTRELSQQLLMRLLVQSGQRAAALAQYEQYRAQLQAELGVEVSAETAVLAEQIRNGEVGARQLAERWLSETNLLPTASPLQITASPPHPLTPSPFIAGPPITQPARFFGREREVKRLFNLWRQRPLQNAAIIGPRRSGKTSLLHYLKTITMTPPERLRPSQAHHWLPDPAVYRWVFVDFQDARLGSMAHLLRHLLTEMALPAPEECRLDQFLDIVSAQLQNPTVILFDEIGVAMERYQELDDAFWESLRSLATNQVDGNLAFVLSSHEAPDALARHRGWGSPFFNIFGYTAVLGPLAEPAARELIAASPLPVPDADANWMLEISGNWPMPLQILCRERLLALEEGDMGDGWREDALRQAAPFLMG
ncbi:MAG TPA: BTAD domain-containing putative transcriptional regulator [Chloroflexota bacterium]|nr:BTAD domain-containing putative transcriptional regulator [Chloroflexota bacterium]